MKKIVLAGSITVFIMILVGLIVGFYLMGFRSPMMTAVERGFASEEGETQPDLPAGDVIDLIIDNILNNWKIFGVIMGVAVITSVVTGGSTIISFVSVFLPVFIVLAVANLFFFPIMTDMQGADTSGLTVGPLGVVLAVVFNVLLMLVIIEFVTGRS